MVDISDKERFPCKGNERWDNDRPMTYFWNTLNNAFEADGIVGLRREVCLFLKTKCESSGVYLEFANCLTHIMNTVEDKTQKTLLAAGVSLKESIDGLNNDKTVTSIRRLFDKVHEMYDLRVRKRDYKEWHIKLSKMEKAWL